MTSSRVAVAIVLAASFGVSAQSYVISTVAGGVAPPTPSYGASRSFGGPQGVTTDAAGNAYFTSLDAVFKLDRNGVVTRVAGNSRKGYSGDGGPAVGAQLSVSCGYLICASGPNGLAVDSVGNLFIADTGNNRVRRVSPEGVITTVVGNGVAEFSGDGGPATNAGGHPIGVAVDGSGNLYVVDWDARIRKVGPDGIITTVAGRLSPADYCGSVGGVGSAAVGVAVDGVGNLFVADIYSNRICRITPGGIVTTAAGNGTEGFSGDGGAATSAQLHHPSAVAIDDAGTLFILDHNQYEENAPEGNRRIRKVSSDGIITTVAGGGKESPGDRGSAIDAVLAPSGVAVDNAGNLFVSEQDNGRIRRVSPEGTITTVVGNGDPCCYSGDGGSGTNAQLYYPTGLALDSGGALLIADGPRIRKLFPDGTITTVAGSGAIGLSGDGGPAADALLGVTSSIAVDGSDNIYLADLSHGRVRKISRDGIITTVAGNGTCCSPGDGGPALDAAVPYPTGIALDSAGNLFIASIADTQRVRKVSPEGIITTIAGGGQSNPGEGGPATNVLLLYPRGLAVDGSGSLYIAEGYRVRKVSPQGIITTVAGNGTYGFSGDGGLATAAQLYATAVSVDGSGNLFVADFVNRRIRKISPAGIISTVAGNGGCCYSGDGGPATQAEMPGAAGLVLDRAGNLYLSHAGDNLGTIGNAVRVLRPVTERVLIGAVADAASGRLDAVAPGKIVVVYGEGLGPSQVIQNRAADGRVPAELGGTTVSFNGLTAPVLYTSATQVAAVVPYALTSATAQVKVTYQGEASAAFEIGVASSAPGLFTRNQSGAGQAAAINVVDGSTNTAANPVKRGAYLSLYATGEGQTSPRGSDGMLAGSPAAGPVLPVSVTVDGIRAEVQYAGGAPGQVAGLMQINVRIPESAQSGGYVPVILRVGNANTIPGAVWIAVAGN
jgi:uncharacterized protein (TIGR03437 family)